MGSHVMDTKRYYSCSDVAIEHFVPLYPNTVVVPVAETRHHPSTAVGKT